MKVVYVVQHVHILDEDEEDVKMIGVYSTAQLAQEAIERLKSQPGFCNSPEGFTIDTYQIDQDHWDQGYVSVPML